MSSLEASSSLLLRASSSGPLRDPCTDDARVSARIYLLALLLKRGCVEISAQPRFAFSLLWNKNAD